MECVSQSKQSHSIDTFNHVSRDIDINNITNSIDSNYREIKSEQED